MTTSRSIRNGFRGHDEMGPTAYRNPREAGRPQSPLDPRRGLKRLVSPPAIRYHPASEVKQETIEHEVGEPDQCPRLSQIDVAPLDGHRVQHRPEEPTRLEDPTNLW